MSIILNNLRQLRKKTPLLFTIIIIVQVLVSFSILYVIGSIANDYFSLKEDRTSTLFLDIHFETENETVTLSELEPSLSELSDGVLSGSIDNIGVGSVRQSNFGLYISVFSIENGKYRINRVVKNYVVGTGRNFNSEDFDNGVAAVIADKPDAPEEVEINGCKIKVIGIMADNGNSSENLYFTPQGFKEAGIIIGECSISLTRILTPNELDKLKEILTKHLGNRYNVNLKTMTNEDANAIMRSSMLISGIIALTSVSLLIMVYAFILKLRKRNMAICRLTGCSKRRLVLLLIGEMGLLTLPFLFLGIIVFDVVKRLLLIELYPYLKITHTIKLYLLFGAVMTVIMLAVLTAFAVVKASRSVRGQITDAGL